MKHLEGPNSRHEHHLLFLHVSMTIYIYQDAEELFQIILASIDKERDLYTHPGVSGISGLIRTTAFEPLRRIYFNSLPLPCKKCPSKIPFEGSLIRWDSFKNSCGTAFLNFDWITCLFD